jgi:TolC family type I secretion outer membrane protein
MSYRDWLLVRPLPAGLLAGLLLAVGNASAAEPALSWPDAVREAAARNGELKAARDNFEAAQARRRSAASGFYPQLSADVGVTDSSGSATTNSTLYSASLNLTQNLFSGFLDKGRVEQALARERIARADLMAARAKLSRDLKTAYAGLLYAQDNVVLAENTLKRLEDNLRLVQLRYEGGRENKGSFLLTRATVAQARLERLQARQSLATAQTQLLRTLGREAGEGVQVGGEVPPVLPMASPDFNALTASTPALIRARAQEEAAQAEVRLAQSGHYPTLDLTGSVGREGADWTPDKDRRTVGVTLRIPLFSGGRDYHEVRASASNLAASAATREDAERQERVRLRQAHAALVEAIEREKVDREFVEAAKIRADIARSKYNNGLMSFEDWDRIENDLILRQKTALASARDRVQAEAAWEQTLGTGAIP